MPGGDINDAWAVELEGGGRLFVKTRADALARRVRDRGRRARLARGGRRARARTCVAAGDDFLALRWIDAGRLDAAGEEELGRGLAAVHAAGAPAFGAPPPGAPFAGAPARPAELPPATAPDWPELYAEHRLAPLLRMAADRGAIDAGDARRGRARARPAAGARRAARAAGAPARRPLERQRPRRRATAGRC